ncbi:MAG: glycosyltransferase family 39 protein [Rhodospirillaceae bacterium]|nr:glycosyltransferase family 39 protein [Rhodospirillaceae bacterium]
MTRAEAGSARRLWPVILVAAAVFYAAFGAYAVVRGRTWSDEITYVAKSWWYARGLVAPYSDADATWYMPLYFSLLGLAQSWFGPGLITGRILSLVMGALSGTLLFLCGRKLTGNPAAAALGVLVYALAPATTYYFATATPLAAVALLLMASVWLTLKAPDRPPLAASAGLGVLFVLMFFFRQNMILAVAVLAPVYVLVLRERRRRHAGVLAATCIAASAAILWMFPERLAEYAVRLPGLTPVLRFAGLLPDRFALILSSTVSPLSLAFEPGRISGRDIANAFLLPYAGTILGAAAALILARKEPLWLLAPALFFFLAATHYLGSVGYCPTCILTYTNYFVGLGALAAGAAFAVLWARREQRKQEPLAGVLPICAAVVLLNVFASGAVRSPDPMTAEGLTGFPAPMLRQTQTNSERDDMAGLARAVGAALPDTPVLVLHNLPSITYAVFAAGRVLPPQSLNLWQSYREIAHAVAADQRPAVVRALEAESLWTDDTLARWLARDYDAVVYQQGLTPRPVIEHELARNFDLAERVEYRGWKLGLYVRRERTAPVDAATARAMVCELESVRRGFAGGC